MGSLIYGARAWRLAILHRRLYQGTAVHAVEDPNLLMTLGFCQWYKISSSVPTGFVINSFALKWISQRMKQKVNVKGEGKKVQIPGISEFIATLTVKLQTPKALASKISPVLRYHGMLLVG